MTNLNPYINFNNETKDAMEFYHSVLGGELTTTTFKEGGMSQGPETDNLIMHAQLKTAKGFLLMASDAPPGMDVSKRGGMTISLSGDESEELKGYWNKLAEGANVTLPLSKSPWNDEFGMLTDKFGVEWMVNISQPKA